MTDGFFPVRHSRENVLSLFERLDHAVSLGAATLVLDRFGFWGIRVHDPKAAGFTTEDWTRTEPLVREADEILVYVLLEPSSNDAVREWASEYDAAMADIAVERVSEIRAVIPTVVRLWAAKNGSTIAGLGEINVEIARNVGMSFWYANLYVTSLLPGPLGEEQEQQHLNLRLFPSDITYLRSVCDTVLHRMAAAQRDG